MDLERKPDETSEKERNSFLTNAKDVIVEMLSFEIPNYLVLISLHLFLTLNNRRSTKLQLGRLLKRKLSHLTVMHEQPANLLLASPSLSRCDAVNPTRRSEIVLPTGCRGEVKVTT